MQSKQFQFSLRTVLFLITTVAVLLAIWSLLPRDFRLRTTALLAVLVGSGIVFVTIWLCDRVLAKHAEHRSLPIASMMLISTSTWISLLALLPLQNWIGDSNGMLVFCIKEWTMLILLTIPILCGLIGKMRLETGRQTRFYWLFAAIASYIIAWQVVGINGFFPTV
jgi:hypothetical protein